MDDADLRIGAWLAMAATALMALGAFLDTVHVSLAPRPDAVSGGPPEAPPPESGGRPPGRPAA